MIYSIQYLRGIAAILVVLYHARGALDFSFGNIPNVGDFLFAHGYFGVDLFFIISGFVIVLSTQNNTSIKSFLIKRIFRVYPLYLFCLLCILFFTPEHYSLHDIIRALFLIQSNYSQPAPWFGYSIVFVAWTLSFEVLFYIIFCLAMYISHKYRVVLSSLMIVLMTCGVTAILGGNLSLDGYASLDNNYGVLRFISSPMFFEFISGMMISVFYINRDKFHYLKPFAPFISSIGLFYFILFYFFDVNGGHGLSNSGLASFSLIFSLLLIEIFYGTTRNNTLSTLGDLSYSIYLNQAVIFSLYPVFFKGVTATPISIMVVQLSLVISVSFITFNYIEKPSMIIARKMNKLISTIIKSDVTEFK